MAKKEDKKPQAPAPVPAQAQAPAKAEGHAEGQAQVRVWLLKHPALGEVRLAMGPYTLAHQAAEELVAMTGLKSRVEIEVTDLGLMDESEVGE